MFLILLLVTFAIATAVSVVVAAVFRHPVQRILARIIADDLSSSWLRYLMFALFVVGISSGVRVWDLEKYVTKPSGRDADIVQLTGDRWILEVYRTVIGTLQGVAWVLLVFFVIALIVFVLVRTWELRRAKADAPPNDFQGNQVSTREVNASSPLAIAPGCECATEKASSTVRSYPSDQPPISA